MIWLCCRRRKLAGSSRTFLFRTAFRRSMIAVWSPYSHRIIFVIRTGLRWCDASTGYGPHKRVLGLSQGRSTTASSNSSRLGVFKRIFDALAVKGDRSDRLMIDPTHQQAHRTRATLLKKESFPAVSHSPKAYSRT